MSKIEEIEEKYKNKLDEYTPIELKLGDLIMKGWKMLLEICPVESKKLIISNCLFFYIILF